jgi:phosphatidate cytidylyltransferase
VSVVQNAVASVLVQLRSLPKALVVSGMGIVGLLLFASFAIAVKTRVAPRADDTQLRLRMKTWWWMVGLLFLALALGHWGTLGFLALVSFLALREYLSLIPTARGDRRVLWWTYALLVAQYCAVQTEAYELFLTLIPAGGVIVLSSRMLIGAEPRDFTKRLSTLHLGLLLTVYSLSHIAYLTSQSSRGAALPAGGAGLVVLLLALSQLSDISQYVSGRTFGRHKVSPSISPNKTVEGLIGGILTTATLGAVFGRFLAPLDTIGGFLVGAAIAIAGFIGDLGVSALKRDLCVKDTGTVLPGHGGVLDRVDSLTIAAPVYFHLMRHLVLSGGHIQ